MRYHWFAATSPVVGMVNEPLAPVTYGLDSEPRNGCVWVSWWKTTHQLSEPAGSVPCSASVAEPLKLIVLPALYSVPAVGVVIVGDGAVLAVTVSVAALELVLPALLLTTQRN